MRIGILGTGVVGRTLSAKLLLVGNEVMMGTRDVEELLARSGREDPFPGWRSANPGVRLGSFSASAEYGELLVNATSGIASLEVLSGIDPHLLNGKVIIDVANALDFSKGSPPTLAFCNTDSLGERIQHALPHAKVVKALNTMNAEVMVDPRKLAGGDHHLLLCGNDPVAKRRVADLLRIWFGWKSAVDLGDITAARAMEMLLPLWLRLWDSLETPLFNLKIVQR